MDEETERRVGLRLERAAAQVAGIQRMMCEPMEVFSRFGYVKPS